MSKKKIGLILVILFVFTWLWVGVSIGVGAPSIFYEDAFRLYTGEVIIGELLSFDGTTFKIETERGIIEKKRSDIVAILIAESPLMHLQSLSQWASKARASSQYGSSNWSAQQATLQPNVSKCGDTGTAWAPKSSGSEPEWLELSFDTPVYATKLCVHETYNTGSIYKIEFVDVYERKHTIWEDKDTTTCPGWFEVNINQTRYLVKSVILHTRIEGYEEIDAVELTGIVISK